MTAPLPNLLITVNVVPLEKCLLVLHKILIVFVNTLTADDKNYLLNRDNLTQPIQMQLYQKQKTFSEFFSYISKIYIKLETFAKKA